MVVTIKYYGKLVIRLLYNRQQNCFSNMVTSENKRIHTPPPSPPFKLGVFVVFYR